MDAAAPSLTLQGRPLVLSSQVTYDFAQTSDEGFMRPRLLGQGRFAKVYAAQQNIAGQASRSVAIKVLHEHADYQAEDLFSKEVDLNREFASGPTRGVSPILDVIHLDPLVMCGCGTLYHPKCPRGCGTLLQRNNSTSRPFPSLRCGKCDYELSAEYVHQRRAELYTWQAKPCCKQNTPHANSGTILNFVLREAMIMECLDQSLADFAQAGSSAERRRSSKSTTRLDRFATYFGLQSNRRRMHILQQKVRLLSRIHLMVQLSETVVWLHGTKQVVHKDLAPDNIMVRRALVSHELDDQDDVRVLLDRAANLSTEICVIDFGLSDKEMLSRNWYEDADISMAATKLPYLAQEARHRRQPLGTILEIDWGQHRFLVPPPLEQSPAGLRPGDTIADTHDPDHDEDMKIFKIEDGFAYFEVRDAQPKTLSRHLEIIRPLGEAHDVYALGAIFFYILTGRHDQVDKLSNLASGIQDQPCPLDRRNLSRRDNYANRRNNIREPFWRDELMCLILRAMVRGQPESFVSDRTERGPGPAHKFLAGLKLIQQGLIAEVFAERDYPARVRRRRAVALGVLVLTGVALWLSTQFLSTSLSS